VGVFFLSFTNKAKLISLILLLTAFLPYLKIILLHLKSYYYSTLLVLFLLYPCFYQLSFFLSI
jgi:hypothetical protein